MSTTLAVTIVMLLHLLFFAPLALAWFKPNLAGKALGVFGILIAAALGSHFAWSFGLFGQ